MNEALKEWTCQTQLKGKTHGMIVEYDVNSHLDVEFTSKEEAAKSRRTAAKLKYRSLDNPMIACSSSMSSPWM